MGQLKTKSSNKGAELFRLLPNLIEKVSLGMVFIFASSYVLIVLTIFKRDRNLSSLRIEPWQHIRPKLEYNISLGKFNGTWSPS